MEKIKEIINQLEMNQQIKAEDIPDLDLYMDQVIQLFERNYATSKRKEDEKILTKTMINNYAKGKLFFPIKNKRYSKEHILLINLIYQLKGGLTLHDIKLTLEGLNDLQSEGVLDLETYYETYLTVLENNTEEFKDELQEKLHSVENEMKKIDSHQEELKNVLTILSFVHMSNLYRKTAEKLIDQLLLANKEDE
ncbi:DUF1836 domain-containing protein [Alkalihalobacillus trypoxylicola]|uniref:Cytoplasmic protein n=1 Tax=Alkalihalobacillus trypoxylicola TaxID=519424 RepID=A0A161Q3D1_9BACI|nr:DUF1836 domain-containing protein [Alkalihalobacillus trypoxylicola]KYG30483.1 hypothetical protein AZF04_19560 [Alkalihalobacillus trypoxylicola]